MSTGLPHDVDSIMAPMTAWPLVVARSLSCPYWSCLLHNVIPAAPACAGLIAVPFATIVSRAWAAPSLRHVRGGLLVRDLPHPFRSTVCPLLSYSNPRRYFSFGDMAKVGWIPSLVMVLITVFITPVTAGLLGLG